MAGAEIPRRFLTPKEVKSILNKDNALIKRSLESRDNTPMDTEVDESMKLIGLVDSLSKKAWTKTIRLHYPADSIYQGDSVVAGVIVPVQKDNRAHVAIFKTGDILLMKPSGMQMMEVRADNQNEGASDSEEGDKEATTLVPYRGQDHEEDAGDVYRSFLSPSDTPFILKIENAGNSIMEDIRGVVGHFEQGIPYLGVSHKNSNPDDVPVLTKVLNTMQETAEETLEYMHKAKRVTRQTLFDALEKHTSTDPSQPELSDDEPEEGPSKE